MNPTVTESVQDIIGKVSPPIQAQAFKGTPEQGIIKLINVALQAVLIIAGLFTLINFIQAGYGYIMAGGDSKKVAEANSRITYTAVGLIIIVLTPLLAAVIGIAIFGQWDALLNPHFTKLKP